MTDPTQDDALGEIEAPTISYRRDFGLFWPSTEHEGVYRWMVNRVTDVDVAVKACRTTGVAVQAGGFIGMWPMRLAKYFERVYTFEPISHLVDCLVRNTEYLPGVIATRAALGAKEGTLDINYKRGGCTRIVDKGRGKTSVITIDSLDLVRCDAIFLDVERHELEVLKGAKDTIAKWHPVIMLEIKDDTAAAYDEYMDKLGYSRIAKVHGDVVYKWGK